MIFAHLFCITCFSTRAVLIAFLRIATHCLISAMRAGDLYLLCKRLCSLFAESLVSRVCCMVVLSEVNLTSVYLFGLIVLLYVHLGFVHLFYFSPNILPLGIILWATAKPLGYYVF